MNTRHLILKGRAMTNTAEHACTELALLVTRAKAMRTSTEGIWAPGATRETLRQLTAVMERSILTIQAAYELEIVECLNPVTVDELRDAVKDAIRAQSSRGESLDVLFGNIGAGLQTAWGLVTTPEPTVTPAAAICATLADLHLRCTDARKSPDAWASDIVLLDEICDVVDRTISTIKVRNGLAPVEQDLHPVTSNDLRDLSKTLARHGGDFYELHTSVGLALPRAATFLAPARTMSEETRNVLLDQMLNTQCADAWEDILGDCEATTWLRDREEQNAR